MTGIHVSSEEVLRLRAVATEAAKNKQSIVFLPCHRSHVDYVSLQLVCYRLGLALPTVVAGDNLNFPLVGTFLQHAGGSRFLFRTRIKLERFVAIIHVVSEAVYLMHWSKYDRGYPAMARINPYVLNATLRMKPPQTIPD